MACEKMSSTVYKNSHKQRFRDYKRSIWHDNFFTSSSSFSSTSIIIYCLRISLPRAVAVESIWVGYFSSFCLLHSIGSMRVAYEWANRRKFTFFGNVIYSWFYRSNLEAAWRCSVFPFDGIASVRTCHRCMLREKIVSHLFFFFACAPHLRFVCRCFCRRCCHSDPNKWHSALVFHSSVFFLLCSC